MNEVVEKKPKQTVDLYIGQVLPPEKRSAMFRGLPSHIRPEVFERNIANAVMSNPNLMSYHPSLLFREISKAAALGLLLDPQLGEGYILEVYNYKTKSKEPQFRPGYRGLMKLGKQSGEISQIYAHEVCRNDHIVAELGAEKRLEHRPNIFGDRGPEIGFYAVVKYTDGSFDFEPMDINAIHKIRDRSEAWKAYKEGKIKSTPWSTDETEMAKKTVLRRLIKRIPQSPEMADAVRYDEEEYPSAPMPPLARNTIEAGPPPAPQIEHDPQTGEIYDVGQGEPEPQDDAPSAPQEREADNAPAARQSEEDAGGEHPAEQDLQDFEKFCRRVRSEDSLDKERDKWLERMEADQLSRAMRERVQAAYESAVERIEKNAAGKGGEQSKPTGESPTNLPPRADGKPPMAAKHEEERAAATSRTDDPPAPDNDDPPSAAAESDDPPSASDDPPAPDDEFPGDKPSAPKISKELREAAEKRADKGSKRFSLWYRSLSADEQKAVDTIGAELRGIINAADEEIKRSEEG